MHQQSIQKQRLHLVFLLEQMQQNQNQAAPQQKPGVPPGAQHGQNTASMKPVPPEEFTGTCYEAWKKRIEEWVVLFSNLDAAQKVCQDPSDWHPRQGVGQEGPLEVCGPKPETRQKRRSDTGQMAKERKFG